MLCYVMDWATVGGRPSEGESPEVGEGGEGGQKYVDTMSNQTIKLVFTVKSNLEWDEEENAGESKRGRM